MKPIRPGIYQSTEGIIESGRLLVAVTPKYHGDRWHPLYKEAELPEEVRKAGYRKNLETRLRRQKSGVLVFEYPQVQPITKETLGPFISTDTYFVIVSPKGVAGGLFDTTWDEVAEFVKEHNDEVDLVGGNIDETDGVFTSCLGTTYNELKARGIKPHLELGCCFENTDY